MNYEVIHAKNRPDLESVVNAYLKGGWTLVGGVSVAIDANGGFHYYQAMLICC